MQRLAASVGSAIAIAAFLALASPILAQDSAVDRADAYVKKNHAEIDAYLAKHPVRSSPLFDAAGRLTAALGKLDALIADACEDDPNFPYWGDVAQGLRENTVLALGKSYEGAMRRHIEETPAANTSRDPSLCADEMLSREKVAQELPNAFAALRRQGY
jgi:hypothetical protein